MEINNKIADIITPVLENMGYDLVRVLLMGNTRLTLQIMAERKDNQPMTVDDCTNISRNISPILEVEDPIKDSYSLEISSPGINRPLLKPEDYIRFKGQNSKIETKNAINNRKRFNGIIEDFTSSNEVILTNNDETFNIPFDEIKTAKLSIADNIFKETK